MLHHMLSSFNLSLYRSKQEWLMHQLFFGYESRADSNSNLDLGKVAAGSDMVDLLESLSALMMHPGRLAILLEEVGSLIFSN
jgi:hypothetical protein